MKSIKKDGTVLVIDEDVERAKSNAIVFEHIGGHNTQVCTDPSKIFDVLGYPPPDLIFWTLPPSSIDPTKYLKKIHKMYGYDKNQTPIIMLYSPSSSIDFDFEGLVDAYLAHCYLVESHVIELIKKDLNLLYEHYRINR